MKRNEEMPLWLLPIMWIAGYGITYIWWDNRADWSMLSNQVARIAAAPWVLFVTTALACCLAMVVIAPFLAIFAKDN
jgi:hypothetical protein